MTMLIIVPSRGQPHKIAELYEAVGETSTGSEWTEIRVGL